MLLQYKSSNTVKILQKCSLNAITRPQTPYSNEKILAKSVYHQAKHLDYLQESYSRQTNNHLRSWDAEIDFT